MNNIVSFDVAVVAAPPSFPRTAHHQTDEVARANSAEAADVTAELEALLAVGQALARLQNPAGRRRVLNWAFERFNPAPDVEVTTAPAPKDPSLLVGDVTRLLEDPHRAALRSTEGVDDPLDDLFDVLPPAVPQPEEMPAPVGRRARVKVLVLDFVTACRRLVFGVRRLRPSVWLDEVETATLRAPTPSL